MKNWRAAARHRSGIRNQGMKWSGKELSAIRGGEGKAIRSIITKM
jgi:hypothetical protein